MPPSSSRLDPCALTANPQTLHNSPLSPLAAGKFVFSVKDTLSCLEMGAVETLIVWEALDMDRYELYNATTGERRASRGWEPAEQQRRPSMGSPCPGVRDEVVRCGIRKVRGQSGVMQHLA